jgi:small GTP-binding protein
MVNTRSKIVICGDCGVGKTSLIKQYVKGSFTGKYDRTISGQVFNKTIKLKIPENTETIDYTYLIWDVTGKKEHQEVIKRTVYVACKGVFMVFDLTDERTFHSLNDWRSLVVGLTGNIPIVVLANKYDLKTKRDVDVDDVIQYCSNNGYRYFFTSARTGKNINNAFISLGIQMVRRETQTEPLAVKSTTKLPQE